MSLWDNYLAFDFSFNGSTLRIELTFEKQDVDEFIVDSITIGSTTYSLDIDKFLVEFGDYFEYNDTEFTDDSIFKFLNKSVPILTAIVSNPTDYGSTFL